MPRWENNDDFHSKPSLTHRNEWYGNEKYVKTAKFLRKPVVSLSENSKAFNGTH